MSNQNQVATPQFETALTKISNTFFPMIENQLTGNGLNMDDYSKQCVMSAISTINSVLDSQGVSWQDKQLDKSNVTQTLLTVASLKLNSAANPREVYFQLRNVKRKVNGRDEWTKQIEMGIEGDGNDAILSNFGRGVKEVHQYWLVRSEDKFEYPRFKGLEMSPPEWQPTGRGDVVRVVYPITKISGQIEYHIAEREDVTRNLIAHINNNLMNETFGIAKNRYDATVAQKKQIDDKKREIINKVKEQGLKALDDESLHPHISPAWRDPQSRESMIIRKMRNNVVKRIPKDFGNAFVEMTYEQADDENFARHMKEVNENANQELIDVEPIQELPKEPQFVEAEFTESDDSIKKEKVDFQTGEIIDKQPSETTVTTELSQEQMTLDATGTEGPGF